MRGLALAPAMMMDYCLQNDVGRGRAATGKSSGFKAGVGALVVRDLSFAPVEFGKPWTEQCGEAI